MNEMGRGKKDEGETKLVDDPDVIRQGFLKRMKVRHFLICTILVDARNRFIQSTWDSGRPQETGRGHLGRRDFRSCRIAEHVCHPTNAFQAFLNAI